MKEEIQDYISQYNEEIQMYFTEIRKLVIKSVECDINEKLWAKLPSFYVGDKFVRIIPFRDHINIEAVAIQKYSQQLSQFRMTPKGMLQIYLNQDIPDNVLQIIFYETLMENNNWRI
jgi:uncharacterized protein YdhG (YjbR/CyaY superfamily)